MPVGTQTSAAITSPEQLRAELDRTRARSCSIGDTENEEGGSKSNSRTDCAGRGTVRNIFLQFCSLCET